MEIRTPMLIIYVERIFIRQIKFIKNLKGGERTVDILHMDCPEKFRL